MASNRDHDGGWAWVVLAMTSLCHMIEAGTVLSVGLFQVEFLEYFPESTGFVSLLSSAFIGLQHMLGPVSSVLCNVYSIRIAMMTGSIILCLGLISSCFVSSLLQLFITFSIIGGVGYGIAYTPMNIVVGHFFIRRRAVANGISTSAAGVGYALGPYLFVWLLSNTGWRFALSILACITLQFCVSAATCFPSTSEINSKQHKRDSRVKESRRGSGSKLWFLRDPHWWIVCINYGLRMSAFSIHVVHFPAYVESVNVPLENITSLFTAYGITVTLGRMLCGFFCNDDSVDPLIVLIGLQGFQGLAVTLMPLYGQTYTGLLVYQILLSLFIGASYVPMVPVVVQLFGVDKLATVFGWLMMWAGVGILVGPVIAGWIRDVSLSYSLGFHIAGLLAVTGCFLLLFTPTTNVHSESTGQNKAEILVHGDQTLAMNDVDENELN